MTDLHNGDIVRNLFYGFNESSIEFSLVVFSPEPNFSAFKGSDVDISRSSRGGTGGLEHGGSQS